MPIRCILCLLILLGTLGSCEQADSQTPQDFTQKGDSLPSNHATPLAPLPQYHVHAKSGLNYRDAPRGNVLGKFAHETQIGLIEHTGLFEEIFDEQKALHGEWVGVRQGDQTVYVFDAFLIPVEPDDFDTASPAVRSDYSPIYELRHFDFRYRGSKEERKEKVAYIRLSGSYRYIEHQDSLIVSSDYLGEYTFPGYHYLEGEYRRRFLQNVRIQETDHVFIYNYRTDQLHTYPVKDLRLLTHINLYQINSRADRKITQYAYVAGLSLEGKWLNANMYEVIGTEEIGTLVYIGEQNPFQRGKLQSMMWEEIDSTLFPNIPEDSAHQEEMLHSPEKKTFRYIQNQLAYYVQVDLVGGGRHLVVVSDDKVLFHSLFRESEGTSFSPMYLKGQIPEYETDLTQWAGSLFKNEAPVMLGLFYHSFGCPGIFVLDGSGDRIRINCDNRH